MIPSIFNDVIGPVMRGASSSHCAAALRIGRLARDLMDGSIERVHITFDTQGSLPTTHNSQGSDMGLFGGLMGWQAHDERLPDSRAWFEKAGMQCEFRYLELDDPHPNTYHLELTRGDTTRRLSAVSTGGGMIELQKLDGVDLVMGGDYEETLAWYEHPLQADPQAIRAALSADEVLLHAADQGSLLQLKAQRHFSADEIAHEVTASPAVRIDRLSAVLPVRSRGGIEVPFSSCSEMLAASDSETPLWQRAVEYEQARSGLDEAAVISKMLDIVAILRRSLKAGLSGTHYADRILGVQSASYEKALAAGHLLDAGLLNNTILYTTALMEVKSAMGVIVAAPTAGACAALPATCLAAGEALGLADEEIARGMLAAGLIGIFISQRWTFAAEEGGCQAEGGSAAAMAAAALVTYMNGAALQATAAASMALQNMLGLICDPVAGRVEVPCLGKNVMAASNALSCANMALAGFDHVIPLDETIDAARAVSERMPREHRCTALGGLAATPASRAIEKRLGGCGGCDTDS